MYTVYTYKYMVLANPTQVAIIQSEYLCLTTTVKSSA
jgi:hypothetical protein